MKIRATAAILMMISAASTILGQSGRRIGEEKAPIIDIDEKELAKYLQRQSLQQPSTQSIEAAIDPSTYIVGPGDVLRVDFWGPTSQDYSFAAPITPEGKFIIPTVGALDVKDKSLKDVQQEVQQACAVKYDPRNISVTAYLAQLRMIRAHIFGEVQTPGSYTATPVHRVSYFVQQAEGWTQWADQCHVEVRHLSGRVDTLNMAKLYQDGDVSQDPYIVGGEVIYAPRIKLTEKTVHVEGPVSWPGPHQIADNESLLEFLYRVKALNRSADLGEIFLVRNGREPQHINFLTNGAVDGAVNHSASQIYLEHGDRILVSSRKDFVYVHGAVKNPGNFPYMVGYKAADYVGLAGGMEEMANLKNVKVIHRDTGKTEKGPESEVRRGDSLIVSVSTRTRLTQYLLIASQIATLVIAASAVKSL